MPNHGKYPDELRERAVRMFLDHGHEYGSQWEAICSVADKLGPKPETGSAGGSGRAPVPRTRAEPGWIRAAVVDARARGR